MKHIPANHTNSETVDRSPRKAAAVQRVPVIVVSGYLGSGKTTFIASMLKRPDMTGTAVIVNELAEVGIDQSILGDAGADDVLLLSNGCMCCGGGSDLRNAVARLLASAEAEGKSLNRIVVETSGAADPGPILKQICFDPVLRSKVRYAGVLTLFDAQHGRDMLAKDAVGYRQIGLADHLLVTKTDLIDGSQTAQTLDFLRTLNPNTDVSQKNDDARRYVEGAGQGVATMGLPAWLGQAQFNENGETSAHQQVLTTWSITADEPISWRRTEPKFHAVFDTLGDDVLRTKGLLWTIGDDRPLVLHGINRHFHRPVRLSSWGGSPQSRVIVIGFDGAAKAAARIAEIINGRAQQQSNGKTADNSDEIIMGEHYEQAT